MTDRLGDAPGMAEQSAQKQAFPYPSGQMVGTGGLAGANVPTPAVPTLVRALSQMDELNKRLYAIHNAAAEIAQAVGGPYPVGGVNKVAADKPTSAMSKLNDGISDAHHTISDIENALAAMRRALGA